MFSSSSTHKVAVFSCKIDAGEFVPVVFPTYNRPQLDHLPQMELSGTIVEALEATSAAGTYFPVYSQHMGGGGVALSAIVQAHVLTQNRYLRQNMVGLLMEGCCTTILVRLPCKKLARCGRIKLVHSS